MAQAVVGGGRAQLTRTALLAAARQIFTSVGYADANITDIVERANSSVGSLYHHFGGKSDLYIALFEDYQSHQQQRAVHAFRDALAAGEDDALALFITGTRAYLEGCWQDRKLARLFLSPDGPPGFELQTRQQFQRWLGANLALLNQHAHPLSDMQVLVLTTVATVVGREVAVAATKAKAYAMIHEVLDLMVRLYAQPS
jgi:AcrR family transcriptional regulator